MTTEPGTDVLTAVDLHTAADALSKACCPHVAHAYPMAYGRLLAEDAGGATEIRLIPECRGDCHPVSQPIPRRGCGAHAASAERRAQQA